MKKNHEVLKNIFPQSTQNTQRDILIIFFSAYSLWLCGDYFMILNFCV